MPSSVRQSQSVARKQGRGGPMQGCGANGLRDALETIADQIGDADKRQDEALAEMQDVLSQLTHKVDGVRAGFSKADAAALRRIEDGLDILHGQLAHQGQPREWQPRPSSAQRAAPRAPLRPSTGAEAESSWDEEQAEALTRVYERAQSELRRPERLARQPSRDEAPAIPAAAWQGQGQGQNQGQAQGQAQEPDRGWLEARLAGIDGLLRQALDDVAPEKSLEAVKGRLDQFEARFDAALENVARRSDLEGLALLDAQLKELTRQFEHTRDQLARLDTIDEGLRDLALGLNGAPDKPAAELDSKAIETLIDAAADRAAARLSGAATQASAEPDSAGTQKRIEALEELLQDYVEERRRGEEVTASILHTIEGALSRIVDRVDAMDAAKPLPLASDTRHDQRRDGLEIESERLVEAYAAGARVLGQGRVEHAPSVLDAADYTSFAPRNEDLATAEAPVEAAAEEPQVDTELDTEADLDTDTQPDLDAATERKEQEEVRPSNVRTRLLGHASAAPGSQPRTDAGSTGAHRSRLGSVLAMSMLLLFGTGYLLVDVLMTHGPATVGGKQPAAHAEAHPAGEPVDPAGDGLGAAQAPGASQTPGLAASPESEAAPPAKRPPSVPETVTDDFSLIAPDPSWLSSARATQKVAPSFATTTAAITRDAGAQAMLQGRSLVGRDQPLLPTGIGPAALRNAAVGGDADAAFEVATRYAEGKGVSQDLKQALAWYQRAAAQGHASAQFRVAAYHERGIAVAADSARAALWYRRAAEQGHLKAMHNLAVMLAGRGTERADYVSAARWFKEAAERGLTDSQFNLAALCEDGHGVARSLTEAYKWFALAARSGDRGAAGRLGLVKARLAPTELVAAEQLVATWQVREAGAAVEATGPSE